jgi:dTDP-4-dehydrorhamnose reductase
MKLVVTGAGGGLGSAFLSVVPRHHDVVPLTHSDLDVTDHHAAMQTVVPLGPDAILNLAAMTAVDACETNPDAAYRSNTVGPANLALAALQCGAALLHVSTDYVFDGEKGSPYDELDVPAPLSAYGRSKLGGEIHVRTLLARHFIVRTALVFGGGDDYLSRAADGLARGEAVGGLTDGVGSFTFVRDLAERLLPLVLTGRFGTYHLAGPEGTTFYDVLTRVKALAGYPGEVTPQTSAELRRPARRPRNSTLVSLFVSDLGIEPMPPLDVSLKELIDGRDR